MNNPIFDADQRQQALDPRLSFIVQAPAGSGKTELLTQRFLVLLDTVNDPEEIIAITFTKKSAAEMRARIIHAIQKASSDCEPTSDHAKATFQLARRVLLRSQRCNWDILQNPNRLRIQTIDSFNAYLTRQLPILSRFGSMPDISDSPYTLYELAVQEFLTHLEENVDWSDAIAQLLIHMDNDLNKVHELLVNMLAKRDQWLPYITLNANHPELRQLLESHLQSIVTDCLSNLTRVIPTDYHAEILTLMQFAAGNLTNTTSALAKCTELTAFPSNHTHDLPIWHGLSELLFTKSLDWRKRLTQAEGFPAPSSSKNPAEKQRLTELKDRMMQLIANLSDIDAIRVAFNELHILPLPYYHDQQWLTLAALQHILRIVVAQLHVIFQEQAKIDFIESAAAAVHALGTDDAPTDLSLALDYKIQHILIDEFQDTSNSQYRLIEKLTAGWEQSDGRTLFLVGDPMQSIYRFREADVGLFIRARKQGIGHIKLIPLTLSVNFRSTNTVVNWINNHFQHVLPSFEDIGMGAVSYSKSIANQNEALSNSCVELHAHSSEDTLAQANHIVNLIAALKAQNPSETIAILVRSRNNLASIIPALKNANLSFRAIDIDPLITRPVIQDLMALTKALLNPADRIAWLSILRAPWCGLTLSDLLILSRNSTHKTLWEQLMKPSVVTELSHDGQQRLARILPILTIKIADRYRHTLHTFIESTWILLGGPASAKQESDLDDADEYFKLLDKLDVGGDIPNIDRLPETISQLYASPNNLADHSLQIMTIHNAKGLEFDSVILPHLERKSPNDDKQLMLWMERTREQQHNALILAPINAIGNDHDPIYDYIKHQHDIKSDHEIGRLLYVAATRAKKQLHLFFSLKKTATGIGKPIASSMLEKLWPVISNHIQLHEQTNDDPATIITSANKRISRLSLNWINPVKELSFNAPIAYHNDNTGFKRADNNPKFTGIVIHQILQQLCQQGTEWWQQQSQSQQHSYLRSLLMQQGIINADIEVSLNIVTTAIQNTLTDPKGLWILNKHPHAETEFHLTTVMDGKIEHIVIDRTFVDDNNIRWIIDYKSTLLVSGQLSDFLTREAAKYAKKLALYQHALQNYDQREVRVGLYFPMIPAWHELFNLTQ